MKKLTRALCIFVILGQAAMPDTWADSSAQLQGHNNDRSIAAQVYGRLQPDSGNVSVAYFGNMAFQITSPGGIKVFIDPWRNDVTGMYPPWFLRDMPIVRTDVGLITHAHYDHDAIERLEADMVLDRMVGEFSLGDVNIVGIGDKHVCEPQGDFAYRIPVQVVLGQDPCAPDEKLQWVNSIYVIETGGLRILHWGDNRQNPSEHVWDMIGDVDVAILAISDEGHILSQDWADVVMKRMNANIVIPSHYYVEGVHIPGLYGLRTADEWVERHQHTNLASANIELDPDMVASHRHHVFYFGQNIAFPPLFPGDPITEKQPLPDRAEAWRRFDPAMQPDQQTDN